MSRNQKYLEDLYIRKYKDKNINLCRDKMEGFVEAVINMLFPVHCEKKVSSFKDLSEMIDNFTRRLFDILSCLNSELHTESDVQKIVDNFILSIPDIEKKMNQDAEFILKGDPAAQSLDEVVVCYPGFYAICVYRVAHFFYLSKVPLFPRILTEYAHRKTGIDIHPGANIESPFFIDHGTGVVIGETTTIKKGVKIYQGVTLGAKSIEKNMANTKRHPTIEENCVIYANATILGGDTVIESGSIIGASAWITKSVLKKV